MILRNTIRSALGVGLRSEPPDLAMPMAQKIKRAVKASTVSMLIPIMLTPILWLLLLTENDWRLLMEFRELQVILHSMASYGIVGLMLLLFSLITLTTLACNFIFILPIIIAAEPYRSNPGTFYRLSDILFSVVIILPIAGFVFLILSPPHFLTWAMIYATSVMFKGSACLLVLIMASTILSFYTSTHLSAKLISIIFNALALITAILSILLCYKVLAY